MVSQHALFFHKRFFGLLPIRYVMTIFDDLPHLPVIVKDRIRVHTEKLWELRPLCN